MKPADRVRVTTVVAVDPRAAFEVFTDEIDRWWRRGPRFRDGTLRFEGGREGRLVEISSEGPDGVFEVGRVLAWEPGRRLHFEWRGRSFAPGEVTEVEVLFEAVASGTRVTLEHRGWAKLPPGHPVRQGLEGQAFVDKMGLWWAELATSYRVYAGQRVSASSDSSDQRR